METDRWGRAEATVPESLFRRPDPAEDLKCQRDRVCVNQPSYKLPVCVVSRRYGVLRSIPVNTLRPRERVGCIELGDPRGLARRHIEKSDPLESLQGLKIATSRFAIRFGKDH